MVAALYVDELHVDPHAFSRALNASLQHIANVQLPTDGFHVDRPAFVREGSVARDDKGASDARQVGRETLGDAVDEILLVGIAADVGEGQDDNREARWLAAIRRG
jgi:hypothetical protein